MIMHNKVHSQKFPPKYAAGPPRFMAEKVRSFVINKKFLRFWTLFFLLMTFDLRLMTCISYAEDKIIAIVNNEVITQKDLNDFVNFVRMQLSGQYKGRELETKVQEVKMGVLDKLIEDRLILQEAKKSGIKIEESRVKARMDEIKNSYSTDSQFQASIAKQGLVQADLENKIREQLFMYVIIDLKVRSKITVTPTEVTAFYQGHLKDLTMPSQRQAQVITIDREDLAKEAYQLLKKGTALEEVVKKYSLTSDSMVLMKNGQFRKDIEDVIFGLEINQASEPIKSEDKFYIFKLTKIDPPKEPSLPEVQDKIYGLLADMKMEKALADWTESVKKSAYIKILDNK